MAIDTITQLRLMRRHPIWRDVSDVDVRSIIRRSELLELHPRGFLVRENEPATHVHFILDGAVRVFYPANKSRGSKTVKLFGAPSSLGNAECIHGSAYSGTIQALVPSLFLAVPKDVYFTFLAGNTHACFKQYLEMGHQFAVTIQFSHSANETLERIVAVLVAYATQFGRTTADGIVIDFPISQAMLARESDSKGRSVVRALAGLYNAKLLRREKRRYAIASIEALLAYTTAKVPNISLNAQDARSPE